MAATPYELDGRRAEAELSYNMSFVTKRVNKTTWLIVEDDEYGEHPFIYVKLHSKLPVAIVSDTGCAQPRKKIGSGRRDYLSLKTRWHLRVDPDAEHYVNLREYIETQPIEANGSKPLNADGARQYIVICTHCHYDHTGGIMQFLRGGTTDIIASAAGRDFIKSGLPEHSFFPDKNRPTPYYHITHWATAFERLSYPLTSLAYPDRKPTSKPQDLGITILQTSGHTPDELAWYDHSERHLYAGDSFYERGADNMPILWPPQGNWIEWAFSMQKVLSFVRSQNSAASSSLRSGWEVLPSRVKVSCAHQTCGVDAEEIMEDLKVQMKRVLLGQTPVVKTQNVKGVAIDTWMEDGERVRFAFQAPRRLCEEARAFFKLSTRQEDEEEEWLEV